MEKKIALFAVALIIIFASNSVVLALSPMGPPKALLGEDRWEIGVEYGYQKMDLEASGNVTDIQLAPLFVTTRKGRFKIKDLASNIIMGRVSYGISDNWDAFARVGVADAEDEIERIYPGGATPDVFEGFEGSFGIAWGFGTRATFWQDEDISWGGLFQITWSEPDDGDISLSGDPVFSGTAEFDIWEVQIAVGPTLRLDDNIRVYGGPFLHFVNGDLDLSGQTVEMGSDIRMEASTDLEEESQFGGFAGVHMDVGENTFCYIEGQYTSDAWGVGVGVARRF
jgi:hypothetical protein